MPEFFVFVWTPRDVLGIIAVVVVLAPLSWLVVYGWYRQWRCKHSTFYENRACDAICAKCGKNLGFIGNLRGDKQ